MNRPTHRLGRDARYLFSLVPGVAIFGSKLFFFELVNVIANSDVSHLITGMAGRLSASNV
jgi:hypothetical protein